MTSPKLRYRPGGARILSPLPALFGALAVGAVLLAPPAKADESPFASIYTTEVLPQGAKEFEQWLTWKHKKPQEQFDLIEGRSEIEYGFSNRFLGSLYLNYEHSKIEPQGPGAPDDADDTTKFTGVNAEFIYQVLNPITDPFGFALYFEPSIGDGERALEFKLLFQKNFLDDRLILAANLNAEFEWEHDDALGIWEHGSAFEIYLGASYRFAPGWYGGVELLNENGFEGHFSRAADNAFYFGPTIHYASENWWATLGVFAQLPWAGNPADEPDAISNGYLVDAERMRLRFRLGILF